MSGSRKYLMLGTLVAAIDQLIKWLIIFYVPLPTVVTSFLSVHLALNRGISWGLLNGTNNWLFVSVTVLISIFTLVLLVYAYNRYKKGFTIYGETLVIAGSLSNSIDRIVHGGVVDFIAIHIGPYTWPVFNLADCAIVLGVGILFVQQLFLSRNEQEHV